MRILVQNLTRLGDLLQSQPALAELAAQGHTIALACLENFAGAATLLPQAGQVFPLPGAALLASLEQDWRQALTLASDYIDGIRRSYTPQAVVNMTSTVSARLLARSLVGDATRGFGLDRFGFRQESTPWAVFLEASSANRGLSPFNIVDLFRKAAGVGQGRGRFALARPTPLAREAARQRLAAAPPETAGFVGLQLGASAAARQWPVASFAALGDRLWARRRLLPVLLGGPGETGLADAYRGLADGPCLDLIGRTDLVELAAVLFCLRLLVTNDTGTLHLAAGLDVPSVALFFATAQPFDTGPYRPGCLCLEPAMPCHPCSFGVACPREHACLSAIGPELVGAAVEAFCDGGRFLVPETVGVRAWMSEFDAGGFMDLRSLTGHDREPRAVWLRAQRSVLRRFLDGDSLDASGDVPLTAPLPEAVQSALTTQLAQSADLLRLLAGQAGLLARAPTMKAKFLATWDRVRRLWLASPHLAVLGHLWLRQAQDPGSDLPALLSRIDRYAAGVSAFARLLSQS